MCRRFSLWAALGVAFCLGLSVHPSRGQDDTSALPEAAPSATATPAAAEAPAAAPTPADDAGQSASTSEQPPASATVQGNPRLSPAAMMPPVNPTPEPTAAAVPPASTASQTGAGDQYSDAPASASGSLESAPAASTTTSTTADLGTGHFFAFALSRFGGCAGGLR